MSKEQLPDPPKAAEPGSIALNAMKPGQKGIITACASDSDLQHRLRELGLVRGTLIELRRVAPFGDPIEVSVRGYQLSLRRKDASQVLVRQLPPTEKDDGHGRL